MPNWVFNTITINNTNLRPEEAERFFNTARSNPRDTETSFSFWGFVTPPQDAIESGEYDGTNGFVGGERVGNTANNWYNWNVLNWGTKWDACDSLMVNVPALNQISVEFNTAWADPRPVFEAICQQFPTLDIEFSWEEEQGWGGEAVNLNGEFCISKEWDIPNSHADNEDIGRDCQCEYEDDSEFWYDDCPRKIELLASNPSEEL
jgi:hypothetical protein